MIVCVSHRIRGLGARVYVLTVGYLVPAGRLLIALLVQSVGRRSTGTLNLYNKATVLRTAPVAYKQATSEVTRAGHSERSFQTETTDDRYVHIHK
jgi:hypothetical protein